MAAQPILLGSRPGKAFLQYVRNWLRLRTSIKARYILFSGSNQCLVLGDETSDPAWVVIWSPYTRERKHDLRPTHWYDWDSIPSRAKANLNSKFVLWRPLIDESLLERAPASPFQERRKRKTI